MAEYSFPFTAVGGDRTITSEQQRTMNAALMSNGVLKAFAGSVAGTTLTLTAGGAIVEGAYYDVGTSSVNISLASVVGSVAYLMLRFDSTARSVTAVISEAAPVRSGGIWELPIATMTYSGSWSQPTFAHEWAITIGGDAVGSLKHFATATLPAGWLACDGAAVSRTTYSRLFAAIGTTFGAGNGSTTFNLPNLKGRVIAGFDAGQSEFNSVGKTGGAKTHTLTTGEMPAHTHNVDTWDRVASGATGVDRYTVPTPLKTWTTTFAGGGGAHNNLQPFLAAVAAIRA